jgi:CRISPR system Cascade subunit CasC
MRIELHMLQNFPPSCLNRDDTNSPKDCEFGGVRRARISSQSVKRAIRQDFARAQRVTPDALAVRTKLLVERVSDIVSAKAERERSQIEHVVEQLLAAVGLDVTKKGDADTKTEYLLFLPSRNVEKLGTLIHDRWDELAKVLLAPKTEKAEESAKGSAKATAKEKKKAKTAGAAAVLGNELTSKVAEYVFEAKGTPELALFGRMIADKPKHNVDAACQVAHAISTHRVAMEFDFYTAVDDLKPPGDAGADMMGTIQFNSACFYRYSVVDLDQLARTLAGAKAKEPLKPAEKRAAAEAVKAWVQASVKAIPSARQNGFAAFNLPEVVLVASREAGSPMSLANAFVAPVRAGNKPGEDIMTLSARALGAHLADLTAMYGGRDAKFRMAATRKDLRFDSGGTESAASFDALVDEVMKDVARWEAST